MTFGKLQQESVVNGKPRPIWIQSSGINWKNFWNDDTFQQLSEPVCWKYPAVCVDHKISSVLKKLSHCVQTGRETWKYSWFLRQSMCLLILWIPGQTRSKLLWYVNEKAGCSIIIVRSQKIQVTSGKSFSNSGPVGGYLVADNPEKHPFLKVNVWFAAGHHDVTRNRKDVSFLPCFSSPQPH